MFVCLFLKEKLYLCFGLAKDEHFYACLLSFCYYVCLFVGCKDKYFYLSDK